MIAYKLLHVRANGTVGPLFINRRQIIPLGKWLVAEDHPTPGYKRRPGWHVLASPYAPHLSLKGRVWYVVEISHFKRFKRPASQGGLWYLAQRMKLMAPVKTPSKRPLFERMEYALVHDVKEGTFRIGEADTILNSNEEIETLSVDKQKLYRRKRVLERENL
jgi:hypothetical protein